MPGVVTMDNGIQNGVPGDHDVARPSRMNDLPDEIQHITQGYVPLGLLLSRLAQRSHNQLSAKILELAKMQVPAPAVNGNSSHAVSHPDDTSVENISKKASLLNFIQELHGRWTKALVIASWSRKAPTVSKLIDLMNYINMERQAFDDGLTYMANIKRDLTFARLPNPDLQTALQVLSTGNASWMPDFGYIEPPPLSAEEQLRWIEELNTLLSLRLNLEEHDKIPHQFRDYTIESGRVTFQVKGEFEVDLTIADEDFEQQFWFLDFRFAFTPAPAELTETLRVFLEARVNEALEKEGLRGCYGFLHEFVLTHKISEYVRQGHELARGSWVDTLNIERLNRSMAIQYWTKRYSPESPKSWLIVGVHSGKRTGATVADSDSTSYLALRWFRDNKEIKGANIAIDDSDVSTEALLKKVIARHVEHILSTIHGKLQSKGRFLKREAALALNTSTDEPIESSLQVQLGQSESINIRIAPTTGFFSMTPSRVSSLKGEARLNNQPKDPTEESLLALENVRYGWAAEEMNRKGKSMGWGMCRSPVKVEELRPILQTKESFQQLWFKRKGWPAQWFLMTSLSLAGDRWWLIEVANPPTGPRIVTYAQVPLSSATPELSDKFFANLTLFSAAMISHATDLKIFHQRHIKHAADQRPNPSLPPSMKVPTIQVRLSDILSGRPAGARKVATWAKDYVQIKFKGIEKASRMKSRHKAGPSIEKDAGSASKQELITTIADARFQVADPSKFSLLKGNVEQDVAFNTRLGVFALQLKMDVGSTMVDDLASRIQAIERLVDCVDAIRRSNSDIKCDTITLAQVVFTYSDAIGRTAGKEAEANIQRWRASLDLRADQIKMSLEKGNPHLRVLDSFNQLINSELGFSKVPHYLAFTLPVLKALDLVEDSWDQMEALDQGYVEIFSEHLDWFTIKYTISGPNKGARRTYRIGLKLRERRGTPCWHVTRCEPGADSNPDDELKAILNKVWSQPTEMWQTFGDSASCNADDSVIGLLGAVDEALRQFAKQPPPSSPLVTRQPPTKTQPTPKTTAQPAPKANNSRPMQIQANRARQQQQSGSSHASAITLD
ncbi:Mediator of RNA polymerase II transcription subunit 14 [Seiridium cupressi]